MTGRGQASGNGHKSGGRTGGSSGKGPREATPKGVDKKIAKQPIKAIKEKVLAAKEKAKAKKAEKKASHNERRGARDARDARLDPLPDAGPDLYIKPKDTKHDKDVSRYRRQDRDNKFQSFDN